jgi:hypothetical protein
MFFFLNYSRICLFRPSVLCDQIVPDPLRHIPYKITLLLRFYSG